MLLVVRLAQVRKRMCSHRQWKNVASVYHSFLQLKKYFMQSCAKLAGVDMNGQLRPCIQCRHWRFHTDQACVQHWSMYHNVTLAEVILALNALFLTTIAIVVSQQFHGSYPVLTIWETLPTWTLITFARVKITVQERVSRAASSVHA